MSKKPPLTDEQIHAKLSDAWIALSRETGETEFGENVLKTARKVLFTLQMALMKREAKDPDGP